MSTEDKLRDIATRWLDEGWRRGNADVVAELHAPHFVDRDSAGRPADRDGFRLGIERLYAAFPDFQAKLEDLVIDAASGKVAVRWTGIGTQQGEYLGAPPSGRRVTFKGIEIIRIEDDRIVERWGEWDGIDLLVQLGRVEL
ncbi:MAG: ester cyclase [bacterium]